MRRKFFAEKYISDGDFGCGFVGFIFQPKYRLKFVQEADMQVAKNGNNKDGIVLSSSNYQQYHL
ncbi:hypothetical protein QUA83_09685 [Microcoleus sp. K1-B1]|uniref:hypothetical protein n=1 Tax=Microcoleus sp. K1-B6 TaxID=2818787 RepID=UPI002FD7B235